MPIYFFLNYAVYGFAFLLILASAYYINKIGEVTGKPKISRMLRTEAKRAWIIQKDWVYEIYKDEALQLKFHRAGVPIKLSAVRFQVIRDLYILSQLLLIHAKWGIERGPYPISQLLFLFLLYIGLSTNPKMPLSILLGRLENSQKVKKNRELIMLYAQLLNEYAISGESPTNLYNILRKFRIYYPALHEAFDKALYLWRKSPEIACEAFAKEIGTKEAKDLSDLLRDVDKLSPQEAFTLLQNRYDHFNILRMEDYRRRFKDRGIIGYFVTFVPSLSVVINFCYIYVIQYQELVHYTNF